MRLPQAIKTDGTEMNVLFVCNGNVSRSQVAETLFNHLSEHQATSAGTAVGHLRRRARRSKPGLRVLAPQSLHELSWN